METHALFHFYMQGSPQLAESHNQPTNTMPLLRIRSKEAIGRAKPAGDVKCKKHPKHKQSPGVCSLCLSGRLSQLSTTHSSRRPTFTATGFSSSSSSSMSSYSCSSTCSSCASPLHRLSGKNVNVLNIHRSLAPIRWKRTINESTGDRNKRIGFWSKLLRPKEREFEEGLMHSRTIHQSSSV